MELEEVKRLLAGGYSEQSPAMQGLGYRHLEEYLGGEIPWEAALQKWKRDTKRFAKRQETWFKAEPAILWFDLEKNEPADRTADRILEYLTRVPEIGLFTSPALRASGEPESRCGMGP